jgi:iron complex transport system ATP-binding protein
LLQAADVSFAYDDEPVLRGVSLVVRAGGFVGILGPNGSGKTTLLRLLAGTLRPTRGTVTFDGADISRLSRPTLAQRLAVVPQETHLAFDYTALEVVLMGRYPHLGTFEIEGPADLDVARDALAATGTRQFEDRLFTTLSGGEKQRVIIAAALAQLARSASEPEIDGSSVLLLDEPTTALDLAYQLEVVSLLRDLHRRRDITVVVSTHDLNFAATVCSSLVLLREGLVLAAGATAEVLTAPNIAALYGVDAEVTLHPTAGHIVVVPIGRIRSGTDA